MFSVCHAFASVYCCLGVTCWERAGILALDCDVLLCFCHFLIWYPGSDVVFDLSIPDLCDLPYFQIVNSAELSTKSVITSGRIYPYVPLLNQA